MVQSILQDVRTRSHNDMRTFITGVNGQLGHDCLSEMIKRGHVAVGSDVQAAFSHVAGDSALTAVPYIRLDITDEQEVKKTVCELHPDVIIHCAAWTAVDAAEDEDNQAKVMAVNADGTRFLAEAAKAMDAKMLYVSTDYVFDGKGDRPWKPDDVPCDPLNCYGKAKLAGEQAVNSILRKWFVIRTAWLFGSNGDNFIRTMIHIGETHPQVRVVSDQFGTPTYAKDLARLLADMAETKKYGFYHATNSETAPGAYISWADLAEEVYRIKGMGTKVIRVSTPEYVQSKAARPANSRLDKSKLTEEGFIPLPDWKDALARYISEAKL